jgi:hypothetical protein
MLKKNDFFEEGVVSSSEFNIDSKYAFEKYGLLSPSNFLDYIKEDIPADIFLLDMEKVGNKAFYAFLKPLLKYIEAQSLYWHDASKYYNFGDKNIDDSALSAFEILPDIIIYRLDNSVLPNKKDKDTLVSFIKAMLKQIDFFDEEIFASKKETEKSYHRLLEKLIKNNDTNDT